MATKAASILVLMFPPLIMAVEPMKEPAQNKAKIWENLLSVDERILEAKGKGNTKRFAFSKSGFVSVYEKDEGERPMTYRIIGDLLQISFNDEIVYQMRLLTGGGGEITVEAGKGKREVYLVKVQAQEQQRIKWETLHLVGRILEQKSKTEIGWFQFHEGGTVSATYGTKRAKDGKTISLTFPLHFWKISGDWLHILDSDGKVLFQWRVVKAGHSEITVDSGLGRTEVYEVK